MGGILSTIYTRKTFPMHKFHIKIKKSCILDNWWNIEFSFNKLFPLLPLLMLSRKGETGHQFLFVILEKYLSEE